MIRDRIQDPKRYDTIVVVDVGVQDGLDLLEGMQDEYRHEAEVDGGDESDRGGVGVHNDYCLVLGFTKIFIIYIFNSN